MMGTPASANAYNWLVNFFPICGRKSGDYQNSKCQIREIVFQKKCWSFFLRYIGRDGSTSL